MKIIIADVQYCTNIYCIAGNFRQVKLSTNLAQWYCAKFSPDLLLTTPKFLPERVSNLCKCCVNVLRRWQVTSMERERVRERKLCLWLSCVVAMFASSITIDSSDDKRSPAGSGRFGLCHGKPSCSAEELWQHVTPPHYFQTTFTVHVSVMYCN